MRHARQRYVGDHLAAVEVDDLAALGLARRGQQLFVVRRKGKIIEKIPGRNPPGFEILCARPGQLPDFLHVLECNDETVARRGGVNRADP
ncbi:hypothetical protein FQZ97_987740 [compost metagenome]